MSFDIHLSKIECFGKHGIYDNEKDNDQKFLIDIYIKIQDFSEDNIGNTVNYEEVVDLVIKIVEHESFDLIESLSKNIVKQKRCKILRLNVPNFLYIHEKSLLRSVKCKKHVFFTKT